MIFHDKDSLVDFFHAVQKCQGQVLYFSTEGDQLNLKSTLCQFLFSSALLSNPELLNGRVVCEREEDLLLLQPFLKLQGEEQV